MTKGYEDVELPWTAGDGGVCGSEDFGTVTCRREVFDQYEHRHLVCHRSRRCCTRGPGLVKAALRDGGVDEQLGGGQEDNAAISSLY